GGGPCCLLRPAPGGRPAGGRGAVEAAGPAGPRRPGSDGTLCRHGRRRPRADGGRIRDLRPCDEGHGPRDRTRRAVGGACLAVGSSAGGLNPPGRQLVWRQRICRRASMGAVFLTVAAIAALTGLSLVSVPAPNAVRVIARGRARR